MTPTDDAEDGNLPLQPRRFPSLPFPGQSVAPLLLSLLPGRLLRKVIVDAELLRKVIVDQSFFAKLL